MARPRNPDSTRTRLLEVGLNLFAKRGYHGTGIKEIVDTAHVPKGSFYNYFKSKEEFGIAIVRRHSADFWEKWHGAMDLSSPEPLQALHNCFTTMLDTHQDCAVQTFSVVAHVAAEICEDSAECRLVIKAIFEEMCDNIAKCLLKAQSAGQVRPDLDPEEFARLFWDAWQGSLLRMKIMGSIEPVKQCVAVLFGGLLHP